MPVFHIYLNGKKLCTAGIDDTGVVAAHISWVRRRGEHTRSGKPNSVEEELRLEVGGNVPEDQILRWVDRKLKIGDELRVVIVKDAPVDKPRKRQWPDPAQALRRQKRRIKAMAKKFGWKIQTKASRRIGKV